MTKARWGQVLAVVQLEMRKTFFSRRGLWVYLLAFAPAALFLAHSLYAPRSQARLAREAGTRRAPLQELRSIEIGLTQTEVLQRLGEPYFKRFGRLRSQGVPGDALFRYTDGFSEFGFLFANGKLRHITRMNGDSIDQSSLVFATVFQFFYLRLAIFFGCVGIFMNLFRGEMLDKSLHFYLLTPIRREALLAGKYLAGLLATVTIFTASTAVQFAAMLWEFDRATIAAHFAGAGWSQFFAYAGVTALACVGYGSVFLAAGLFFKNPIIPAAMVLVWESANLFLPAALKQISLIFYLQSLCPVVAAPDEQMPLAWKLLIATAQSPGKVSAVCGIFVLTAVALGISAFRVRKLEINYSTD
jgi:ABC-type transport system involved in multi-copper enzyme maturation permease subunit